jgi:signal transduction histidine kinase
MLLASFPGAASAQMDCNAGAAGNAMSSVAPEARRLLLTTSFEGHATVLLLVQDSGRGIAVEDREPIRPFFTTKSGGMGLGLAICVTEVENHGGKLRLVKSDSDGSIFEVAIPVGLQHSAEQAMVISIFGNPSS